jgi:hypothetical protein
MANNNSKSNIINKTNTFTGQGYYTEPIEQINLQTEIEENKVYLTEPINSGLIKDKNVKIDSDLIIPEE